MARSTSDKAKAAVKRAGVAGVGLMLYARWDDLKAGDKGR